MSTTNHPLRDYIVSGDTFPIYDGVSNSVRGLLVWYFCGGKRFQVLLSKVPPVGHEREGAIEVEWVKVINETRSQGGPLTEFELMVTEKIKVLAIPIMVEMAPPLTAEPPTVEVGRRKLPQTAEQLVDLYLNTVKLQLVTRNGELEIIRGHSPDIPSTRSLPPMPIPWTRLTTLSSSDIQSIPTFPSSKVTLLGQHLYGIKRFHDFDFEATISGSDEPVVCLLTGDTEDLMDSFLYQLAKLIKIRDAGFSVEEVRVPIIKGLITHGDGVVGVILGMISHTTTLDTVLYEVNYNTTGGKREQPAAPLPSRQKWVAQIEQTLMQLHSHGIVWSPHPEHVVIDRDGNAHLTDFTDEVFYEWVPRRRDRLSHSVEADLEGLEVIKRWLLPELF